MEEVPLDYFVDKPNIEKYSNPKIVQKKGKLYGLNVVFSPRKNKKYRIVNPNTNKFVDFGSFDPPMEDYTKHKDKERLKRFKQRNARWYNSPKYSASWLSAFLLWN